MGLAAINSLNSQELYKRQQANPFNAGINGQQTGQPIDIMKPVQPVAPAARGPQNHYKGLNEVAQIGALKAAGFQNGMGGTNNRDDHKLFVTA